MSIDRSGVFTWTVPRTSSQCAATSSSRTASRSARGSARSALRLLGVAASPRKKTISTRSPGSRSIAGLQRPARVEAGADPPESGAPRRARPGCRACRCARGTRAGRRSRRSAARRDRRRRRARRTPVPRVAREHRAGLGSISVTMNGAPTRRATGRAPTRHRRSPKAARPPATVARSSAARS